MLSYAHGAYDEPLLGETIGAEPRADGGAGPGRASARLLPPGAPLHVRASSTRRSTGSASGMLAAGLSKGDRVGVWSPNRAEWALTQYATAKLGVILVNINPAYRVNELEYALGQSGCRWIFAAPECRGSDFVAMVDAGARRACPRSSGRCSSAPTEWEELAGAAIRSRRARAPLRRARLRRPDQHPVHERHDGFPKGATLTHHNILNNGYFVGGLLGYTEPDRVCIPVPLYHCFGMVMGNLGCDHPRRVHGVSGRDVRARGDAASVRAGALHEPLRRADDVHRPARAPGLRRVRPRARCGRGSWPGSPCPIEVMKRVSQRDGDRARWRSRSG